MLQAYFLPSQICLKVVVDIIFDNLIHSLSYGMISSLQVLELLFQQNIIFQSLCLLLITHGCGGGSCSSGGSGCWSCLFTGGWSPVGDGMITILSVNFGHVVKLIIARDQFVIKIKLHQLCKWFAESFVELDNIVGEIDILELHSVYTHGPVHI